jgi:hypothetical protein
LREKGCLADAMRPGIDLPGVDVEHEGLTVVGEPAQGIPGERIGEQPEITAADMGRLTFPIFRVEMGNSTSASLLPCREAGGVGYAVIVVIYREYARIVEEAQPSRCRRPTGSCW